MSITKKDVGINCLYFLSLILIAIITSLFGVAIIAKDIMGIVQLGYYSIIVIILVLAALITIHVYSVWIIKPSYKKFSRLREFLIVNSINNSLL